MPTVAHLTSVHPPRDPRIFHKECRTLAAAGYDVFLVAPGAGASVVDGVHFVEFPREASRVKRALGSSRKMADLALDLDADVYHFHDPELLPMGRFLAARGRTVIYDAHEHLAKNTAARPYLHPLVAKPIGAVAGGFEHWVARRLAAVVAATPTIAEEFAPGTVVVANYPDLTEWADHGSTTLDQYRRRPPRAVYVGAITVVRNGPEMIAAAAMLDTPDAEFHFAGRVSGMPEPSGQRVVYHGVLDRDGLTDLLETSRVGISVFKPAPNAVESLPTKTFEYMAAGLPVVVSRETTTQADLVADAGCGLLVPHDSPAELARAVDRLLADPEMAFEMGQRGRSAVESQYSWGPQAEKLLGLYSELAPLQRS